LKPAGSHAHEISGKPPANAASVADLRADIERLGRAEAGRPVRVAIASYEFVGVVRNGGIGTACSELALALAGDGHEVDLVFTGWGDDPSEEGFERWRDSHRELGISLTRIDLGSVAGCDAVLYNAAHSLALYKALKQRDDRDPYDVIHFVESLGHGFFSLLAKRQGLAFQQATTVVCTHSPRRWLAEAHGLSFDHPVELGDEFLESRSLELADVVVSPSAHMLEWLRDREVRLPERSYVQQYVTDFGGADVEPINPAAVEELVFFGRLEPRKGIVAFCDALDLLADGDHGELKRIAFLGKETMPPEYLERRAAKWPWACEVISDLDRDEALRYLSAPGRLAVMASTMDNSPNTVYETIGLGISFLASRGGGTAELVHPDDFERVTYDPRDPEQREVDPGDPSRKRPVHSGRVLARRLAKALETEPRPARYAVAPDANRETHLAWHRAVVGGAQQGSPTSETSTTPESLDVRELTTVEEGPAEEMLLLIDADVSGDLRLGAKLAAAAESTGAEFVTAFGHFVSLTPMGPEERLFVPTGGPASTGLIGNCAGAGVALARRGALRRIGAFEAPDGLPASVAELLARAVLAGERVDVVPEALYRLPESAVSEASVALPSNPIELLRPYHLALPADARDIAALASRMARDDTALRAQLHEANMAALEVSARFDGLVGSRSFKMTKPLRWAGKAARRVLRRPPRSG
jgi:O-antigen biosynthesis protein